MMTSPSEEPKELKEEVITFTKKECKHLLDEFMWLNYDSPITRDIIRRMRYFVYGK